MCLNPPDKRVFKSTDVTLSEMLNEKQSSCQILPSSHLEEIKQIWLLKISLHLR